MKPDKALGAMHHLGHRRQLAHHWHDELLPGCVLQAQARRLNAADQALRITSKPP